MSESDAQRKLERERYLSLATFRRTGKAVETPVWFAGSDGRYYVFSEAKAGKVKRLRNDGKIRVAACNVRGAVHGPWLEGQGRRVEDEASVAKAYEALHAKYGWQMKMADFFSRLSGRYDARAILELTLDSAH